MPAPGFAFCHPFRIRYSEVDAQGIVYNAHYLTFFDVALWEYFRALPWDIPTQVRESGTDYHTVRATVEYHRPVLFDQEIEVSVRCRRIGRSSLGFDLDVRGDGGDGPMASGDVVWVNADQASRQSVSLPDLLMERIERLDSPSSRSETSPGRSRDSI